MSFLVLISLLPRIYKRAKTWKYQYDTVLFFGSRNASGRLKFTTHHDPNDTDTVKNDVFEIKIN